MELRGLFPLKPIFAKIKPTNFGLTIKTSNTRRLTMNKQYPDFINTCTCKACTTGECSELMTCGCEACQETTKAKKELEKTNRGEISEERRKFLKV